MSARKDACFVELFWDHTHANGEPQMIVGLKDALATAQQLGIRCIAVTNAQRGAAEASIAALRECIPAASIIEGLVVGAECAQAKPAPDPYIEGMRQLGVCPSECIVFEDSASGVRAGVAANVCGVVGIRTTLTDAQLRQAGCDVTLADWTEFSPEFLTQLVREKFNRGSPEGTP